MERFYPGSLDETTIPQAATDEDRPGRPRRLTNIQQNELELQLHELPTEAGSTRRRGRRRSSSTTIVTRSTSSTLDPAVGGC
jgi:hypothetical protein